MNHQYGVTESLICPDCDYATRSETQFGRHMRDEHAARDHQIGREVQKQYARRDRLKLKRQHAGEKS